MKLKPKTYTFFIPRGEFSYAISVLRESKVRHWPFRVSFKDNRPGYTIEVEDNPIISFFLLKYSQ
jgi:hypothetical protein